MKKICMRRTMACHSHATMQSEAKYLSIVQQDFLLPPVSQEDNDGRMVTTIVFLSNAKENIASCHIECITHQTAITEEGKAAGAVPFMRKLEKCLLFFIWFGDCYEMIPEDILDMHF